MDCRYVDNFKVRRKSLNSPIVLSAGIYDKIKKQKFLNIKVKEYETYIYMYTLTSHQNIYRYYIRSICIRH